MELNSLRVIYAFGGYHLEITVQNQSNVTTSLYVSP